MNAVVKDTPILFSGSLPGLVLDELKTMTRRLVKPQPEHPQFGQRMMLALDDEGEELYLHGGPLLARAIRCPYGKPGDRLWVRETYIAFGRWETRFSAKKGRDEWHFVDMTIDTGRAYRYVAGSHDLVAPPEGRRSMASAVPASHVRPSIFMPRAASRISLEITDVRVERLHDITEADCIAEGIQRYRGPLRWVRYLDAVTGEPIHNTARDAFKALWESINGPGSWEVNPWLWVISFRRIT